MLYEVITGEHSFEHNSITKLVLNNLPELLQVDSDSFSNNLIKSLSLNNLPKLAGLRSRIFDVITSYSIHYTKLYEMMYIAGVDMV